MMDFKILMLSAVISFGLLKLSIKLADNTDGIKLVGVISLMVLSGFMFVLCIVGLLAIILGEMLT